MSEKFIFMFIIDFVFNSFKMIYRRERKFGKTSVKTSNVYLVGFTNL